MLPGFRALLAAVTASWLLLRLSSAGFACLSNPCIYGICMDDLNSSYTCYCIDGYTGVHCQTNWDECWSSPCLNGGECHDGVAAFNCSCPPGFLGDLCEENVDECSSNPCANNATCIDVANGYSCMCPYGYTGLHCEVDIAVCNSTEEAQCHNGALCVEGPGMTFTCICAPGWKGRLCNEVIDECFSAPCQNGAVCINLQQPTGGYACACLFGNQVNRNQSISSRHSMLPTISCLIHYLKLVCDLVCHSRCWNGGTCIDGVDNYTCSCPPSLTGRHCECLILDNGHLDCTYVVTTPELPFTTYHYLLSSRKISIEDHQSNPVTSTSFRTSVEISSSPKYVPIFSLTSLNQTSEFTTELQNVTEDQSEVTTDFSDKTSEGFVDTVTPYWSIHESTGITSSKETDSTTIQYESDATEKTPSMIPTGTSYSKETFGYTQETNPIITTDIYTESTEKATRLTDLTEESASTVTTDLYDIQRSTEFRHHTTPSFEHGSTAVTDETETMFSEATVITSQTRQGDESLPDIHTTDMITEIGPSTASTTTKVTRKHPTSLHPEDRQFTDWIASTEFKSMSTDKVHPTDSSFTDYTTQFAETMPTSSIGFDSSTEYFLDCTRLPCLNGGTCVYEKEITKCSCPFGWSGFHCEEHSGIRVAAFTGVSYLVHNLNNGTGTVVGVRARTLAPTGLLFYAQTKSYIHMALYLHNGLLKFLFSCGLQTMLFSELKDRVNNGYLLNIVAVVELVPSVDEPLQCTALAILRESGNLNSHLLYLGGLPPHMLHQVDLPVTTGITGCMDNLLIDGEPRHIYESARDGFEVTECASLACLSSPCYGGSTCIEYKDRWNCLCPSGYIGESCNQSVCSNNPCQFGGTCAEFPGSGFICLCPYGKHGLFCQNDLEIGQPSYAPSVRGISSYTAYPLPGAVHHSFEIRFRFVPSSMDQIALLLFIGQGRIHDSTSDHLAVSFIKGYVVLTWNLGSGPRRIFTPKSLAGRAGRAHLVRLGRAGQQAWLQVDNLQNVTGHTPGRLSQLNTQAVMFVGGHKSINFSGLPHDLPLHTGFTGCIYGVEMRTGQLTVTVGNLRQRAIIGRGVGQCGTQQCHNSTCLNGGACLDHGSTFTCLCKTGWFGPVCALRQNPCDSTVNHCAAGSTCVPLETGYQCDCPLGRAGNHCERVEKLSDVSFSGQRSYISLPAADFHLQQICLDFELRPVKNRGLVVFSGENTHTFLTLSMHGGVLELRVLPIGGKRRVDEVVVVRSGRVLALGVWHRVRAGRFGQRLFLWVDGTVNSGLLHFGETVLPTISPLYIGGIPDLSHLPYGAMADLPVPLTGCVRRLNVNWKHVPLDVEHVLSARNIADCDGTACGGDVCQNGGTCWLDSTYQPHCTCTQYYTGRKCETMVTCLEVPCLNNGHCVTANREQPHCQCPNGRGGHFCELDVPVGAPHFSGDSFIVVDSSSSLQKRGNLVSERSRKFDIDFLYVNFSTVQPDGMILWSSMNDEYIGLGTEGGLLKMVWAWDDTESSSVTVPATWLADGIWHNVALNFSTQNITMWLDSSVLVFETLTNRSINSNGIFYLGGFPQGTDIEIETRGSFSVQFNGCIRELAWSDHSVVTDFTGFIGENIGDCEILEP
ncbi:protein eyes shut [Nilaparvata lugens]|uniref:protein eyes shut n=1 Tax=Nilaparvata lugens TaxID=108931 RepID=UPI00193DC4E4|nr:protein eyes shut [Nilaparvata lugens]